MQLKTLPSAYTVVTELDRYFYLVDLMVSTRQPVLLVGPSGIGKSSLVQNLINPRHSATRICLSPGLTSKLLQEAIEHKLQQIQHKELSQMTVKKPVQGGVAVKNLPGAKPRTQLMFLDDLNCAAVDAFEIQPPLELLRQILSQGTLYNKQRCHLYRVQHLQFIAACVPPGVGTSCGGVASYSISHRLSRLMTVLSFFPLSSDSLATIYSSVFFSWLEEFPAYSLTHHGRLAKALSGATIKMYSVIQKELRPTPLHPHFLFTQHELSRVVQGMTLLSSKSRGRPRPRARRRNQGAGDTELESKTESVAAAKSDRGLYVKEQAQGGRNAGKGRSWPSLTSDSTETKTPAALSPMIRSILRLWCHESSRTYSDRLFTEEQRYWFSSLLHDSVEEFFCRDNSEQGSAMFSVEQVEMGQKTVPDVLPGRNAPPPTASDEQLANTGEDETSMQPDDSMALPTQELRTPSDESAVEEDEEEGEVGTIVTEENLLPEEANDAPVDEAVEMEDNDAEFPPKVEEQNANNVDPDILEVQEDETLSREPTLVESMALLQPVRVKVTFDDTSGVSYDKSYDGPLISSEQLAFSGEDLTDIIFCKHYNASVTGRETSASEVANKNYLECAESIMEQGIRRCLASYNALVVESGSGARIMSLVTFRGALRHAARLSRAMATPGGHALLLSDLGYGRRTLTRVTAHAACCKLIEVQRSQFQSREDLRQQVKVASFFAGLKGKPVVLFVPEGVSDGSMQDICSLMSEGTCPGLYTPNELFMISNQLLPGGKRGARRVENQDIAQERYFRRVKSNLHVVVCLKYRKLDLSNSPEKNQLYKFPALVTRSCCVDIYRAWPHEALVSIAQKQLEEEESVFSLLPLKRREKDSQSAAVCSVMAHVHLSSRSMVKRIYGMEALKFFSPDTYLDFIDLFRKICKRLCLKEKEEVVHLDKAIKRIDEATHSLNKMHRELDQLAPVFEASKTDVQLRHETVEACQKEYAAAKDRCKKQEQDIEGMQGPIEILKKEAQAEFEKVNPLFDAAWKAINSLDIHDVEEIRTYRTPPAIVRLVVDAVCLLFEKEQTWEEGKLLLNRNNFFKDLEFYNMTGMPDTIFNALKGFYDNPLFIADIVTDGSVAARSLCLWVRAVYEFCMVHRALEPKRQQLQRAEQELEKAKSILGEMRVKCNAIKQELESNIQLYKDSVKHSRTVQKQIQNIQAVQAKGVALVDSLSTYSTLWHSNRSTAKQHLLTAPGDALVTAAAVCYLGPLVPAARDELFADWLRVCDGVSREPEKPLLSLSSVLLEDSRNKGNYTEPNNAGRTSRPTTQSTLASTSSTNTVPLREDVSLRAILAAANEVHDWKRNELPTDKQALQNALILRSCSEDRTRAWPLLIDPHNQAELWIRALHQDDTLDQGHSSRPETRQSERSLSRQSGRSSIELDAAPALDYANLEQSGADEDEADPQLSDNEVDQFLQSLKDTDDQEFRFQETEIQAETPATSRTERTTGSALTSFSDKMLSEKLAEAMGIQIDGSPLPQPSGPTPVMNLSEGRILVVQADDPQLVSNVRAAVKKGLVALVTHVERRRWDKTLELVLSRQTFTNSEGVLQVIIGKTAVEYNPSFRLYLSSSLPLFMPGEGQCPLPFSKTSTISMDVSREGICDMLLADTLRLERPEFDGQLRSIERDVGLHKQQIDHAKEFILEKVLNLSGPLLKDTSILDSIIKSKDVISMAEERCSEADTMRTELLTKQNDFLPVAQHGALLFSVMCELQKLHPYYCFPLDAFMQLFHDTVAERNRGKKSSGSPAARAAELVTALSRKIFERTSWSLFQSDNHVFAFLLAVEKMMNNGSLSHEEWQLFTQLPSNTHAERALNGDIPKWVSRKVWASADELERLPVFSSLKQSVMELSDLWREYFNLPPVLLGVPPGDYAHLTTFQKALLWKIFQPDQLFQVCQDIVLYQMGASMTRSVGYDLHQVYPVTSPSCPVIFLLPSHQILTQGEANVLKDPITDVINLARALRKDERLLQVTLGESVSMENALTAVKRGMKTGCWVILENCHLATSWSEEFMHELETIVNMRDSDSESDSPKHYQENGSDQNSPNNEEEDLLIHPDFRLWLTTQPEVGLPLLTVVIQHGLKLACEAQENFRDAVQTNCQVAVGSLNNSVPLWGEAAEKSVFKSDVHPYLTFGLAYLHSVLLERRKFGQRAFSCPYQWSQSDLLAGLEALRHLSHACRSSLPPAAVEAMLGDVAYGGHVTNGLDLHAVRSLAKFVPSEKKKDSVEELPTYSLLDTYVDSLPEAISCQELGLTDVCNASYQSKLSSGIADRLALGTGRLRSALSIENQVKTVAEETLNQMTTVVESIKAHDLSHEATTAVASFIQRELAFFHNLLREAVKETELFINACSGHVAFTPDLFNLASSLGSHRAPPKWLVKSATDVSLRGWLADIGRQVKALGGYLSTSPLHSCSYCLGAFAHPQAFLACVLMDHACATMKSVYALEFSVEVLHSDTLPTSPPDRGVFLSDLKITGASWDVERGCIIEPNESSDIYDLPIVWLKPLEVVRSRAPSAKAEKQQSEMPLFDCPLLVGGDWGGDVTTLVTSLPLPTSVPEGMLKQRRVAVVSLLC